MSRIVDEACARCAAEPNRREMIFTRTFRRCVDLFREPPPPSVQTRRHTYDWVFPNGSRITFGHVDREQDVERYHGCQWHLTNFVDYLGHRNEAWLRTRERL